MTWAHPRGCGADLNVYGHLWDEGGSSPRVRGRRPPGRPDRGEHGLIPAGAGQTLDTYAHLWDDGAHPRGCGADQWGYLPARACDGSSPRVRGRLSRPVCWPCRVGLIPAGAGQTIRLPRISRRCRAHPRGCGADISALLRPGFFSGSSPRVRGRPPSYPLPSRERGLIPAGAGQTGTTGRRGCCLRAHPRGCGADVDYQNGSDEIMGSSPRVRGRRRCSRMRRRFSRLIPAGAGQTGCVPSGWTPRAAHPRGCGADITGTIEVYPLNGSSPRVRGRRTSARHRGRWFRLIPAGAGQTENTVFTDGSTGAHPRGCGADLENRLPTQLVKGSSPRVRGRRRM